MSIEPLLKSLDRHPEWPVMQGTAGYANMWGWFPAGEESFPVISISGLKWGANDLPPAGMVGLPAKVMRLLGKPNPWSAGISTTNVDHWANNNNRNLLLS